jgi:hypothetical protein
MKIRTMRAMSRSIMVVDMLADVSSRVRSRALPLATMLDMELIFVVEGLL